MFPVNQIVKVEVLLRSLQECSLTWNTALVYYNWYNKVLDHKKKTPKLDLKQFYELLKFRVDLWRDKM